MKFETDGIEQCLEFISELKRKQEIIRGDSRAGKGEKGKYEEEEEQEELCVMATGGGAYKYYERIKEVLGVEVKREDEMECLIIGKCALKLCF